MRRASQDTRSLIDNISQEHYESISLTSKSHKLSAHHFMRHRWSSKFSYISSVMTAMCSIYYFDVALGDNDFKQLNFFMIMVSYILIAIPLYYMQILLGQYTQTGVIVLRYMSPLGHGVAFGFMLIIIAQSIKMGIYAADFLTYLMHSFKLNYEWLVCENTTNISCWNNDPPCDIDNCLNNFTMPSTYFYYYMVYLERRNYSPDENKQVPSLHRSMVLLLFWLLICLITNIYALKLRMIITRLWVVTLILLSINALNMWFRDYNIKVLVDILTINTTAITDAQAWLGAIREPLALMGLAKGIHVLHGSFIDFGETWESASVLVSFIDLGVMCMGMSFGRACLYFLRTNARMDENVFHSYWNRGVHMYFVYIPMALSLTGMPQIWNILYFLNCLLLIMGNQLLHLITLEKTFCDAYPAILKYSKYVSSIICIVIVLISVCISSKYFPEAFTVETISNKVLSMMETIVALLFTIFVCWVYGVQKFCDDIHYMRGSQPAKFWKVTWYCLPVVLGTTLFSKFYYIEQSPFSGNEQICIVIFMIPIPAWAVYEIFRFIRKKNVAGLFQSEEEFGPPDPKEKYLRRLFNPRQETKLKRRSEICQHRCLLHSKVVKRAVGDEEIYKSNFIMEKETGD